MLRILTDKKSAKIGLIRVIRVLFLGVKSKSIKAKVSDNKPSDFPKSL